VRSIVEASLYIPQGSGFVNRLSLFIFLFFYFSFGLTTQGKSAVKGAKEMFTLTSK